MKRLIALLAMIALLFGAGFEQTIEKLGIKLQLLSQKPLTTGKNSLELVSNKAIKALKIKFFMPAMPGMPYMKSIPKVKKIDAKHFKLQVNFPMGGTWQSVIYLKLVDGKSQKIKTSISF